tara:strand:- start:4358 stop:4636 length:279 start_codon:yes stop_codon:yes gene_type:complete
MFNEVREMSVSFKPVYQRREPPCDFGDIRKSSIDANLFPFSPQPMTETGRYRIFAYHKNCYEPYTNVDMEFAFTMARTLNERFWRNYEIRTA